MSSDSIQQPNNINETGWDADEVSQLVTNVPYWFHFDNNRAASLASRFYSFMKKRCGIFATEIRIISTRTERLHENLILQYIQKYKKK